MPLGEHERIGVALAAHRRHALDPIAARDESGDAGVVLEANAQVLGAMGGEIAREHPRSPLRSPGAANRAFEMLRSMMFRAEEWGLRERDNNPCLGIAKNPRNNIARFLDTGELARLGRSLNAREVRWPEAVAAIRLLALTGCRRSEVLNLRRIDEYHS